MRQVEGLTAIDSVTGAAVLQGSQEENVTNVDVSLPDWAERVRLGPPQNIGSWESMDGCARIQILYRGVFVMDYVLSGPWGVRGTVWVNPKRFKPRLNRESLLAEGLEPPMNALLQSAHPATLLEGARIVGRWPHHGDELSWNEDRWRTLWLAIPRTPPYAAAADEWDRVLRTRRVIPLIEASGDRFISYDELVALGKARVYVAPHNLRREDLLVRQAVATLRVRGEAVIRAVPRAREWMDGVTFGYSSLVALLIHRFASRDLRLEMVASIADAVTRESADVVGLFSSDGVVKVARLGSAGEAVALVGKQVWLNIESANGRGIVEAVAAADEPLAALLLAIMREEHVIGDRYQIAKRLLKATEFPPIMSPVRRIRIRKVLR
jgi:hypothetical protein